MFYELICVQCVLGVQCVPVHSVQHCAVVRNNCALCSFGRR